MMPRPASHAGPSAFEPDERMVPTSAGTPEIARIERSLTHGTVLANKMVGGVVMDWCDDYSNAQPY